jgi:hypothetical protein
MKPNPPRIIQHHSIKHPKHAPRPRSRLRRNTPRPPRSANIHHQPSLLECFPRRGLAHRLPQLHHAPRDRPLPQQRRAPAPNHHHTPRIHNHCPHTHKRPTRIFTRHAGDCNALRRGGPPPGRPRTATTENLSSIAGKEIETLAITYHPKGESGNGIRLGRNNAS